MDDSQTLELQVKSKAQEALSSVDKLVSKLTGLERTISDIDSKLKTSSVNNANSNVNQLKNTIDKTTSSANKLGSSLKTVFTYAGVKRLTTTLLGWMDEAVNYTEQLNLFNVVFDNIEKNGKKTFSALGEEATRFQYKLNEKFGTNKTETLYMQGIFQSMGETVGIKDKYSAIMSETMTKLTYDLASLYNKGEEATAEAIRAGVYAGQTKPLRAFGIDVTQMSMQPILNELGIDRQVKELSQAEKEILRYLATLKQAQIAMGDFANNLESPANQMKIFKQQLVETKVALSSLFIGTFAKILPYANAILMVIKEVTKAIAAMFGIELKDYNTGIASQEGVYDGIADSAGKATKKAKELKRTLFGWDEVHNIDENKDSGSGSGTSVGGGIDQRLLDAIKGYDNGMDKVRMKATEIRDKIMEWLGFTKEIDPLTGAVSFKLKEGWTNLKLIGGIITMLVGFKIFKWLKNIAKGILGVDNLVSLSGTNLTWLGKIVKSLKASGWSATIGKIGIKLKSLLPVLGKTSIAIAGIAGVILGSRGAYNSMKQMTIEANYGGKEFGKYTASILGVVGGATALGAVFGGPLGAAIGALTGTIIAGTSALLGYKKGVEELAKAELFGSVNVSTASWKEMLEGLNVSINDNTARFEKLKSNLSDLSTTFNDNANKLDYYGIKFGKLSQKISEEDSVNIKNSIKEMCDSTNSIIDSTTTYGLELVNSTFKQGTTISKQGQKKMLESIVNYGNRQKKELKTAQDNITKTYDNAIKTRGYLTDEEYNYISQQLQKIRGLTNSEMSKSQTEIEYYKRQFASKNQKIDEESYSNYKKALDEYHSEKLEKIQETYNQEYNYAQKMLENEAWTEDQFNQYIIDAQTNRNKSVEELNREMTKSTETVISDLKEKYEELLSDNTEYGKQQKKIIEGIFKNYNIDYAYLDRTFTRAGKKAVSYFSNGFGSGGGASFKIGINFGGGSGGGRFANGGIYSNGSWKSIPQYANGGAPSHGTLFWAGEAGAEVVAHASGKTEVLNQSQIASVMYSAIYSAMSQFGGGGIAEINVRASKDVIVETAINGINQQTNQTGICPVRIPNY